MKNKTLLITILFALFMAACGTNTITPDTPPTDQPTIAPTNTIQAVADPTQPAETEELPAVEPTAADAMMDGCTLQTALQQPAGGADSRFAPVTEADWQLGSPEAATTIVEYGDFQ